jgi:hypothetical protein
MGDGESWWKRTMRVRKRPVLIGTRSTPMLAVNHFAAAILIGRRVGF